MYFVSPMFAMKVMDGNNKTRWQQQFDLGECCGIYFDRSALNATEARKAMRKGAQLLAKY